MNIWLITIGEILPIKEDTRKGRTAFLAEKLAERGHNVLWCFISSSSNVLMVTCY